jgi:hypothetical protein
MRGGRVIMKHRINMIMLLYTTLLATPLFSQTPVVFKYNSMYGYADNEMKMIVSPLYDRATDFNSSGYTAVRTHTTGRNIWSVIDSSGNTILTRHAGSMQIYLGHYISYDTDYYCIENLKTGEIIIDGMNSLPTAVSDNLFLILKTSDGDWQFINRDGKRAFDNWEIERYSNAFNEGRASIIAIINDYPEKIIIDTNGNRVGNLSFSVLGDYYSEGLLPAKTKDGVTGYLDRDGEFAFKIPLFVYKEYNTLFATDFVDGFAVIKTAENPNKWRIINNKGSYVSEELNYTGTGTFSEGLCDIWKNGDAGFMDTTGKVVIPIIFDTATPFKYGYSRIVYNGKDGLLNKNGEVFWSEDIVNGDAKAVRLY